MGVHNRDYMRDQRRSRFLTTPHRVTWWIIGINVALWFVYASSYNWGTKGPFHGIETAPGLAGFIYRHLVLHPTDVIGSWKLWQPLTAMWLHDPHGVGHVFWNMILLYFFGRSVEAWVGSRRYLWLYLGGGLASTLAVVAFSYASGRFFPALGASGAVYAVMVWAALHEPHRTIYLLFVLPVPLWVAVGVFMVGLEVLNLTVLNTASGASVGHLAGAAWGWFFHTRFRGYGGELKGPGAWLVEARKRQDAGREEDEAERVADERARVDDLLAKIHEEGISSLSEEEKAFLQEASKRYK